MQITVNMPAYVTLLMGVLVDSFVERSLVRTPPSKPLWHSGMTANPHGAAQQLMTSRMLRLRLENKVSRLFHANKRDNANGCEHQLRHANTAPPPDPQSLMGTLQHAHGEGRTLGSVAYCSFVARVVNKPYSKLPCGSPRLASFRRLGLSLCSWQLHQPSSPLLKEENKTNPSAPL